MSDFNPMTSQEARDLLYGNYPMEDDSDPMIRTYSNELDEGWIVQMGKDSYTNTLPDAPYEDAKLLAHAERALRTIVEMGKPRIIRTPEELEALELDDADTVVLASEAGAVRTVRALAAMHRLGSVWGLPAVVIATGAQVRAAREAMEQEHDF